MVSWEYINLIAETLGTAILKFDGPIYGDHCRLVHEGHTYRITSSLSVEKACNGLLYSDEDSMRLEMRLKSKGWDGEGLPPVGIEAEVSVDGGRTWCLYKATIEHNGMRLVEIGNFTEEFQSNNWTFRPIRSEEDKKRDEAAKGLIDYLDKETDIDNVFSIKDVIGFYDAIASGKIPHIRID